MIGEKPKSFFYTHELGSSVFANLVTTLVSNRPNNEFNDLSEEPDEDEEPMVLNGQTGKRYPIDLED